MRSKHLLDPELAPVVKLASDAGIKPGGQSPMMAALLAQPQPTSDQVEAREVDPRARRRTRCSGPTIFA